MLVGASGFGNGVCAVVALGVHVGTESFVVYFVAVFALDRGSGFLSQFHLNLALFLDSLVGGLESCQQFGFADFVHLAFYHHDIVVGSADHQLHVGFFELLECGIDHKLTAYTRHAHFGDGSVERYVAHCQSSRCGEAGQ